MPAIRSICWRPFRLPFRSDATAAHGSTSFREGLVIVAEDDAGGAGLGEASPLTSYAGGTVAECARAMPSLAAGLVQHDLQQAWRQPMSFADGLSSGAQGALACGLETAIADLLSRSAGQPLHTWLGSNGALSSRIPVNGLVDDPTVQGAAAEAARLTAVGYKALKLKVGFDPASDEERIAAVRAAIGANIELRIDANGAWDDGTAEEVLKVAAIHHISLAEQPVAPSAGPAAMARLRAFDVPLAADESCRTVSDFEALHAAGAMDAIVVKPMISGLREAIALVAAARSAGLPAIVTTTFDSGIGVTLAAHLAATLPEPRPPCGLATHERLEYDMVDGVPSVVDGDMIVESAHGLGLRLDAERLDVAATGDWTRVPS